MTNSKPEEIERLKREKDAVILAHYYVEPEIQAIADYIGDSYQLSKTAKDLPNKTIVFCGVTFMGESAKLLSPEKTVLMPDMAADCPMAHMVKKEDVDKARAEYGDLAVVCYINSTLEIKSWSDVCVTSSNAVKIVKNLPNKNIMFIPDKNLGSFVAGLVPEKNFVLIKGHCCVHEFMSADEIIRQKNKHPDAKLLAHPECNDKIRNMADFIGSTSGIIDYATKSDEKEFIIATETGINYVLKQKNPDKRFYYPATRPLCAQMKKNTPDKIIHVLKTGENAVSIEEKYIERAKATLSRMLELAK